MARAQLPRGTQQGRDDPPRVAAPRAIQVWAPAGFARGFCVLSEIAEIQYKCTGLYSKNESGIRWDDPQIGIQWPVSDPLLSEKDRKAQAFEEWGARPESDHFQF